MQPFRQRISIRVSGRTSLALIAGMLLSLQSRLAIAQGDATGPRTAGAMTPTIAATRLGDLYRDVAQRNPRISAAQALARAVEARVRGATRPPDPQLQLGFMNYTVPGLVPMELLGMTQLQVMQMVPVAGKLRLAGRVAGAQAAAQDERARDVIWELRSATAMGFYDLYATDQQLGVARETIRLLQDIARIADAMYRVGEGRQADVLRARVEIAKMVEDTLRMQAMRRSMVARLNALLDRATDDPIDRLVLPRFPDSLPPADRIDSIAASNRPMIRAGLEEVRAAESAATLARRELFPDLQIGVQYGQRSASGTDPMSAGGTERMGSLMIGASLPIFARDRQLQMRAEAGAMRAMALADVASMRAETRGRIGEAFANLTRARNLARLYRTTILPQAEATVASALSAYRVGDVNFMTLLDNQMTVNTYRQELSTLEADEGKAWADLEMLTGRELMNPFSVARSTSVDTSKPDPVQAAPAPTRGGK